LLQFISLLSNLPYLISDISLGNKKMKNNLHSSITWIFVVHTVSSGDWSVAI